jgi:hypothetical protein
MNKNVGGIDKWARIAAGALLLILAVTNTIGAWGYLGLIPLLTGTLNYCPAYSLLGIKTCPVKPE